MGFWCAKGPRTEEISLKNAELKGEKSSRCNEREAEPRGYSQSKLLFLF